MASLAVLWVALCLLPCLGVWLCCPFGVLAGLRFGGVVVRWAASLGGLPPSSCVCRRGVWGALPAPGSCWLPCGWCWVFPGCEPLGLGFRSGLRPWSLLRQRGEFPCGDPVNLSLPLLPSRTRHTIAGVSNIQTCTRVACSLSRSLLLPTAADGPSDPRAGAAHTHLPPGPCPWRSPA